MTFEEFFKKKKISLALLQQAEPALFAEFETHYGQMGEKSFDHTKKYWFNKLRRLYVLPPEPKPEKIRLENQIAEQTITETLAEEATIATKPAFQPRFKANASTRPTEVKQEHIPETEETTAAQTMPAAATAVPSPATPAFKPRFKPGMAKPSVTAQDIPATETTRPAATNDAPEPEVPPAGKPAFKPRFKPGITQVSAAPVESAPAEPEVKAEEPSENAQLPEAPPASPASVTENKPKPAFKPRFKPGVAKTVAVPPAEPVIEEPAVPLNTAEATPEATNFTSSGTGNEASAEAPKPAYKPRFKPGMAKPKPPEEE